MSRRPIAVFTGDNHLQPRIWAHKPIEDDTYISMRQIVDFCIDNRLPLILLGDLFDKARPDSLSVYHYHHYVQRMMENQLAVYFIQGNHDKADPPWAGLHPWACPLGTVTLHGVRILGLDYARGEQLKSQIDYGFNETHPQVVLAHQAWKEIQQVGYVDGDFSLFPYGVTLLTGDYHVNGTYHGTAANGEPVTAYSPGSTALQAINESPTKMYGILHDDLSVEWNQLETRGVLYDDLNTEEDIQWWAIQWDQELESLDEPRHPDIRKPILRIKFADTIADAYDRIMRTVGDSAYVFADIKHTHTTEVLTVGREFKSDAKAALIDAVDGLQSVPAAARSDVITLLRQADDADLQKTLKQLFEQFKANYGTNSST